MLIDFSLEQNFFYPFFCLKFIERLTAEALLVMISKIKSMSNVIILLFLFLPSISVYAQFPFFYGSDTIGPKITPDTLYFPFEDNIQLIVINHQDNYRRYGAWQDAMYPRGGSFFLDFGLGLKNVYIFRNAEGELIKRFHNDTIDKSNLKDTSFINTNAFSLHTIGDYIEFNHHLKIYEKNGKVGLVNLKGEMVIEAEYDDISRYKYRNTGKEKGKLIIRKGNDFGMLDSNLNLLFPPIYSYKREGYRNQEYSWYDEKSIKVYKDTRCGLISEDGEVLIDFLYDDIRVIHDDMYIGINERNEDEIPVVKRTKHRNNGYYIQHCTVFDENFSITAILDNFEYFEYIAVKKFIVKKDNKFGVFNHLGENIIPMEFDELFKLNGGFGFLVVKQNTRGLLDLDGKELIPTEYQNIQISYFLPSAIYVKKDHLIGIYDSNYKLIVEPQFKKMDWERGETFRTGKYILTKEDGSIGFVFYKENETYYQSSEGEKIKL